MIMWKMMRMMIIGVVILAQTLALTIGDNNADTDLRPKGRETKASGGVHYLRRLHSASMANLGPATPNMGPT